MRTFFFPPTKSPDAHWHESAAFTHTSTMGWTLTCSHWWSCVFVCVCVWERSNCASASHLTAWLHRVEEGACQHRSPTPEQKTAVGTARYTRTMMYHEDGFNIRLHNSTLCAEASLLCLFCYFLIKWKQFSGWLVAGLTSIQLWWDDWHQQLQETNHLWQLQSWSEHQKVKLFSFNYGMIN